MRKRGCTALVLALICGLVASTAMAFEAGDIILRAGPITVDPNSVSSKTLTLNGMPLAGTEVDGVDSDTQLGVTAVYMFTSYFGLELLAATPFTHDIKVKGLQGLGIRRVGDTKQLPPTLSALFYPVGFSNPDSKFQPYLGVGINRTFFWDENASGQLERGLGDDFSVDLDNSWGFAARAGIDYALTENFLLQAGIWWINIETEATFKGKNTGARIEAKDVDIDPWVYTIGVGYRF